MTKVCFFSLGKQPLKINVTKISTNSPEAATATLQNPLILSRKVKAMKYVCFLLGKSTRNSLTRLFRLCTWAGIPAAPQPITHGEPSRSCLVHVNFSGANKARTIKQPATYLHQYLLLNLISYANAALLHRIGRSFIYLRNQ